MDHWAVGDRAYSGILPWFDQGPLQDFLQKSDDDPEPAEPKSSAKHAGPGAQDDGGTKGQEGAQTTQGPGQGRWQRQDSWCTG